LGIKNFIMKPINKTEIARKIRKALDGHRGLGEKKRG
jgi:FixJ family two-component response regulator